MKPDTTALLSVHVPAESLPVPILAILLIGFFAVVVLLIQKASKFAAYARADFPTHAATVIVGLGAFLLTIPVLLARIALGMEAPGGTGDLLAAEIGLAGVTAAMLGAKRFSSPEYMAGKAQVEAAKSASPQVTVTGNANVNTDAGAVVPKKPAQAVSAFGGDSNE